MNRLVREAKVAEHAPVIVLVANLEPGVPAERPYAHDEQRTDRDLPAPQPARGRSEPEDARHRDEDEAIELARLRVRGHEQPQRGHHAEQRGQERSGEQGVAAHPPAVPHVVVLEDAPAQHPHQDRAHRHAEEYQPVPDTRLLRGDRGGGQEDDAIPYEIQVLCCLLGHQRAVAMHLRETL